jgi:aspartyl-tRNA(Asn)/glutamyl-tRNA(Gln) amidotransferase subunit B
MMEEYRLPFYDAEVLSATRDVAEYALAVLASGCDPKLASNWLMTEVLAVLKSTRSTAGQFPVAPSDVAGLVRLLSEQKLSVPLAKEVFARMWSERVGLAQCIRSVGTQVNDEDALVAVCRSVVDNAPAEVAKYLAGKTQIVSWFVGQAMGRTRGTGNPRMLTRIFTDLLEGRKNP